MASARSGNAVSRMPFQPPGEFEIQQHGCHDGPATSGSGRISSSTATGRWPQRFEHRSRWVAGRARVRRQRRNVPGRRALHGASSAAARRGGATPSAPDRAASTSSARSVRMRALRGSGRWRRGSADRAASPAPRTPRAPAPRASRAVIREPERSAASTTTTPSDRPAMIRLRRGKWRACGAVPGGSSATTAPRSAMRAMQRRVLRRVGTSSTPPADDGDGAGRASAPRCAAASMPRARPETTTSPARPRPAASSPAMRRPRPRRCARRPSRRSGASSRPASPRTPSTGGGSSECSEERRVGRLRPGDQARAEPFAGVHLGRSASARGRAGARSGRRAGEVGQGSERGFGRSEAGEQLAEGDRTDIVGRARGAASQTLTRERLRPVARSGWRIGGRRRGRRQSLAAAPAGHPTVNRAGGRT